MKIVNDTNDWRMISWILQFINGLHPQRSILQSRVNFEWCNERNVLKTWLSWWTWQKIEKSFGFKFEWRANGSECCKWPSNVNDQASSSLWVCPFTIKCALEHSSEFSVINGMNLPQFMVRMNKMSFSNITKIIGK